MISVRTERSAVGVERVGCGGGAGSLPRKKHFCSLSDKYGCISTLVSRQKTWTVTRSLATRILRFNRETKFTQTVQKLSKQFTVRPRGRGDRTIAPWIRHCYQAWYSETLPARPEELPYSPSPFLSDVASERCVRLTAVQPLLRPCPVIIVDCYFTINMVVTIIKQQPWLKSKLN